MVFEELLFPALLQDPDALDMGRLLAPDPAGYMRTVASRSPQWAAVRNKFVEQHPACAVCGYTKDLNVHHIRPYHLFPQYELAVSNLITLGERCPSGNHHFLFGHLCLWTSFNPSVSRDATKFLFAIERRP